MVSKCPRLSDSVIGEDFRNTNTCVRVSFEIGHEALRRAKKTPDGFTHDWEVFVRGADNTEIQHFVEKVVFHLHTTFPKPKRAIKEPPYSVKESGYAGFIIPIEIYFKNKDEPKKVRFDYDLSLQTSGPPIKHVLRETFVFPNPPEDLRRRLIKGGGVGVVGAEPGGHVLPTDKAVVVENSPSKHLAPPLIGKPKLGGADTPKKHKIKEHKIEEPRVSSSFADLFGPPIQKTTKVSPDPKKSLSTPPQVSNKLPEKDKQSGKSSRPKDGVERSSGLKERNREREKSKERSSTSASKYSSPPSKPTATGTGTPTVPPVPPAKADREEGKKTPHEDAIKEAKLTSGTDGGRSDKKKKDKRNKDEKSSKKDRHKEREHSEKKHVDKVDKQDRTDKTEKNDKLDKNGSENVDKLKKPEKVEKNNVKEIKEKIKESSHVEKSVKDVVKVAEKTRERDKDKEREKDKEKDRERERDKEKEKDKEREKEKEKHSRGEREKEKDKDKDKQRHKHKKKEKKDRKDDNTIGFKERDKDKEKPGKKEDTLHRSESNDHEKNGLSFESPPSITEVPNRKKSRSPSPLPPATVPREKQPQRPLKKLLDQLTEHSSSDSELSALSPEEATDCKSPTSAAKPESKAVGSHKSSSNGGSSGGGSKQKEKSSWRKDGKEKKDKQQVEKADKDDTSKKRKRKSSKLKLEESEPSAKTPRTEETKPQPQPEQEQQEVVAPALGEPAGEAQAQLMDTDTKDQVASTQPCKSEDEEEGSGKEEFGAPPAPECFTPDYVSQLKDLQHKIMTLEDNTELQRVVQVIAETGQYEITKKTFDFDLCALDRRTVKRLQEFFTASS